ncbi:MAG TPA: non-canonical purine NTP pyrophosphatase [Candidatus Saccharimonadales bacterium]
MQRLPVESTDLVSIGYDPKERVLEIEFKENRIYQYFEVEPDVYERFMRTDSYGEFFYAHINKHYRYKKAGDAPQKSDSLSKLAFVTGNARKFRDLKVACEPFNIEIEQLSLPVDEIQSQDAEEIAVKKAKLAYKLAGKRPVVVNDVYWHILSLRGFPGAYMSHVTNWFRPEDFLALMAGKNDRTVMATDTLVYYDGKRSKVFSETFRGKIIEEPRGEGLSITQIVIIDDHDRTIAEIENQEARSSIDPRQAIWHDFAKWYNLQRRLGKA